MSCEETIIGTLIFPRFLRTHTASANLNSLNDDVFTSKATDFPGVISGLHTPGKNGETGKFLWSLSLLIRP